MRKWEQNGFLVAQSITWPLDSGNSNTSYFQINYFFLFYLHEPYPQPGHNNNPLDLPAYKVGIKTILLIFADSE